MTFREMQEQFEQEQLSSFACLAKNSKGRAEETEPCPLRTCFSRDKDRIVHSKAFRRLKHKTQVFLSPSGDHYRTRLTHTLEVSQISRTIARALRLNEDLTEAIALGHDLGHTPFGHAGERALDAIASVRFRHYEQSARIATILEPLNLTYEVLDGMSCHSGDKLPETFEGQIVRISDRIAYINHDIDDALRGGILREEELPKEATSLLGNSHGKRIDTLVRGVVDHSLNNDQVSLCPGITIDPEVGQAMDTLRNFMFEKVYTGSKAKSEESKAEKLMQRLFRHFTENPEKIPSEYRFVMETEGAERAALDYLAGMTDTYVVNLYKEIYLPKGWEL
ncbi:MAG: deoxyguanosinetriphosphate triphosphohydrolase [Clostridia bacterium]|nr:deoxyguanosinetriphosphate triphosphohydrolase [Clostridia bacterium]MBQ8600884.1 deoxyguanosinetriphosphate triphosphohydrolase [Clostridia bacterium]